MKPPFIQDLLNLHPDLILKETVESDLAGSLYRGAVFSAPGDDGRSNYRYALWRIFDPTLPLLITILLNPSTADEIKDDQTVLRMTSRAMQLGYGGVLIINAFAWRDVSPASMKKAAEPIGHANDDVIDLATASAGLVICGWGSHGNYLGRSGALGRRLIERGVALTCLRTTDGGQPEHPLYLPYSLKPQPWVPA